MSTRRRRAEQGARPCDTAPRDRHALSPAERHVGAVATPVIPGIRHMVLDGSLTGSRLVGVHLVLDPRRSTGGPHYRDDVESTRGVLGAMLRQETTRGAVNASPLGRTDGVPGVGVLVAAPRLDLDEHDNVTVGGDQIDLAKRTPVVSRKDAVLAPGEVSSGQSLAARSEDDIPARPRPPATQASQPPSDGCDVHAACEPSRSVRAGSRAWPGGPCRGA